MIKLKEPNQIQRLMSLVLALAFVVSAAVPVLAPPPARAEGGTWQDLVFLYTTDIKGKIEPCG